MLGRLFGPRPVVDHQTGGAWVCLYCPAPCVRVSARAGRGGDAGKGLWLAVCGFATDMEAHFSGLLRPIGPPSGHYPPWCVALSQDHTPCAFLVVNDLFFAAAVVAMGGAGSGVRDWRAQALDTSNLHTVLIPHTLAHTHRFPPLGTLAALSHTHAPLPPRPHTACFRSAILGGTLKARLFARFKPSGLPEAVLKAEIDKAVVHERITSEDLRRLEAAIADLSRSLVEGEGEGAHEDGGASGDEEGGGGDGAGAGDGGGAPVPALASLPVTEASVWGSWTQAAGSGTGRSVSGPLPKVRPGPSPRTRAKEEWVVLAK